MNRILQHKIRLSIALLFVLSGTSLFGCGKETPVEETVQLSAEEKVVNYDTVTVERRDVVRTKDLTVKYSQTTDQKVSFSVGGKRIDKLYVRVGDTVKPGDLLAELSIGNLEEDIARLEYEISRAELQKSYLATQEEFDLESSYHTFVYNTPKEEDDIKDKDKRDEQINENYRYSREDYDDELEMDRMELESLKSQLSSSRLYATMSGTVLSIADDVEGSTAQKDKVIMTIIDGTSGMFVAEEPDYVSYFHEDEIIPLSINYGTAKGEYEVMPLNMSTWDDKQYFYIVDGPENDGIEVDSTATIHVTLGEKENVLCVPVGAVYSADDKSYVYVPDEDGFKSIKWVKIGLEGNDYIEITEGLSEGETIVRR